MVIVKAVAGWNWQFGRSYHPILVEFVSTIIRTLFLLSLQIQPCWNNAKCMPQKASSPFWDQNNQSIFAYLHAATEWSWWHFSTIYGRQCGKCFFGGVRNSRCVSRFTTCSHGALISLVWCHRNVMSPRLPWCINHSAWLQSHSVWSTWSQEWW